MSQQARAAAREQVLEYCHRLILEHLVSYTAGNISRRVEGEPNLIAMTPTSVPYDTMRAQDICLVTVDGQLVDGEREPTTEMPLHTLAYVRRPELGAIVHTHSPASMAMAALGLTLPPILIGLVVAAGGSVETAPYARTGTEEMADRTDAALRDRGACFLRFHGVLAVGRTLAHAFNAASVVESSADAYLRARALGDVPSLPAAEVEWLARRWRRQWRGAATPAFKGGA
jgi:ribulose-5-phosphate 4-epimerase/fuculose-1-phosphate aldolase